MTSTAESRDGVLDIPTIDLFRFRFGTPEERAAVAAAVDEAGYTLV